MIAVEANGKLYRNKKDGMVYPRKMLFDDTANVWLAPPDEYEELDARGAIKVAKDNVNSIKATSVFDPPSLSVVQKLRIEAAELGVVLPDMATEADLRKLIRAARKQADEEADLAAAEEAAREAAAREAAEKGE